MNKCVYLILVIAIVCGIGVYWYFAKAPTKATQYTPETSRKTEISVVMLKPGDISGSMKVVSIKPLNASFSNLSSNNVAATFSGVASIQGKYSYTFSDADGSWILSFSPLITNTELPQVSERSPIFYFTNQEDAIRILKLTPGSEAHGTAHITIQGYELNSYPSEVTDRSEILSAK